VNIDWVCVGNWIFKHPRLETKFDSSAIVIHTLCTSLQYAICLANQLCLRRFFGNGFQRQMFPFLWVPELSSCLNHSNSPLSDINNYFSIRNSRRLSLIKVKVMLRPRISEPVCLRVRHPSGTHDQICIACRHLRICCRVAPSLTRGWVSNLHLMLGLATAFIHSFSGPSSGGLITIFCCLKFEIPSTWKPRSLYLYPPGTGWPSYSPQALVSHFVASYDS
jgi:hypothetical protein